MLKYEVILKQLTERWLKDYFIYGPVKTDQVLKIKEITDFSAVDWSGNLPGNSWKEIFLPHRERLLDIKADKLQTISGQQPKTLCLGMNIVDLKALMLFDLVFANDVYYQNRRENIIIVGYSSDWPHDYKKLKVFSHNFEEDVLEHVPFDIFIAKVKNNQLKFYSGSEKGRRLLEKNGINDFINIKFAGAISEAGPDKRMLMLQNKVGKSQQHGLWSLLNEICLACGKCSNVCPTCFCFDLVDRVDANDPRRDRVRSSCFFNDFSKIAGGH
jgi:ferredoxin